MGNLFLFTLTSRNNARIISTNIGTVDYDKGEVKGVDYVENIFEMKRNTKYWQIIIGGTNLSGCVFKNKSIGSESSQETIRTGLAMGGDRGILVKSPDEDIAPLNVGKIIKNICDKENPDLIILGKQAIDDDCNQTGQILATLLKYPQATFASKVEKNNEVVH